MFTLSAIVCGVYYNVKSDSLGSLILTARQMSAHFMDTQFTISGSLPGGRVFLNGKEI